MSRSSSQHRDPDATTNAAAYALEESLNRLEAAMIGTRDAVSLKGAEAKPLTGANQRVTSAGTRLMGFAVNESSGGAAASLTIRNGDGGEVVMLVALAAGESAREWFGPGGISVGGGVSVEVTGALAGAMFVVGD